MPTSLKLVIISSLLLLTNTISLSHAEAPACDSIQTYQRFDCYPEQEATEELCLQRGCCWKPASAKRPDLNIPFCYYPSNFPTYSITNQQFKSERLNTVQISKSTPTFRPNEILNLTVDIFYDTKERLRVKIYDPHNPRYEVPLKINGNKEKIRAADTDYFVQVTDNPFAVRVYRKSNNRLIFDTSVAPIIFADQFIQFSTYLPSDYLYGIGEHRDSFQHTTNWKRFTIWNRDIPPIKGVNLYGSHPFYMSMEKDGSAHGFFLLNSNGMDVILQPYPAITFMTIGGILDFFIYAGPTPADVVQQHIYAIGQPMMPPYFSLGFHLCRWNYENDKKLKMVIERNRAAKIPYDTQWTDIDAMDEMRDWTFDPVNFASLPQIVADLHAHGQHYINIIDPAINTKRGYEPYEAGLRDNVFIRFYKSNEPLVGKVWPGETVYPDFTHPNTTDWWMQSAAKFHELIPYDGIWIDMNEPSNFVDGSFVGCTNNTLDEPPYIPNVLGSQLYSSSICPSAEQHLSSHYNLHNMYGHFEAIATNKALQVIKKGKRPFVLSRSTYAGSGVYTAHWSGDNRASWEDLYYSIPIMLNFNLFGTSMIGADICGYALDTTEELCIRWMQLGSFYPFMRNHNDNLSKDQDPGAFSLQAQEYMRNALKTRYALLPYMYTLFYRSHVFGETVVRPLFFEYPADINTHPIDRQYLFGPALLISPVLEPYTFSVDAYFPNDTWYDFYTGAKVARTSSYVNLDAPLSKINVHVRAGHVIPMQHPEVTTAKSRKNPFMLLVTLNAKPNIPSRGHLYWDDGDSADSVENKVNNIIHFNATQGNIDIALDEEHRNYKTMMLLDTIIVYGVAAEPSKVLINSSEHSDFVYDEIYKSLTIQYFFVDMYSMERIKVTWN